jgi:RND family efflux transporter MFP subunit
MRKFTFLQRGLPVLILGLAVGGFMILRATQPALPPVQVEEKAWSVNVLEVEPGFHTPNFLLYGTVEAPRQASLSAAIAAEVVEVPVAEGQRVVAGQTLVILDDRDMSLKQRERQAEMDEIEAMMDSERRRHKSDSAALEREKALLALDEKALQRSLNLKDRDMASESVVDEARLNVERQALAVNQRQLDVDDHRARLAQLEARLAKATALRDQARLDVQRTRVIAPFVGRISELPVAPGDRVQINETLVELYALEELEIRAQIPFRYLPAVRSALADDMPLTAVAQLEGRSLQVELVRLSGATDQAAGGVDGLFRFQEGSENLIPGRLFPLLLSLPPQNDTVILPLQALYGLDRIYRLDEGRMTALDVERIGEYRRPDGSVQVLVRSAALQAGDQIVTTQLPNAVNGLKVEVMESSS